MKSQNDAWVSASEYEMFMGRWSRQLANEFASWLPVGKGAHWLDVGCGTGALTRAVCAQKQPASVVASDPSESFLAYARESLGNACASFVLTGVGNLPTRPGGFDSVTSALALNFFPHPRAAIREMHRITSRGGFVSACVWDYAEGMQYLRYFWDAAQALDPAAAELDEGRRFPMCERDALKQLFTSGDLNHVVCEPIDITTRFSGFDDFWKPFLSGTAPAPAYVTALKPEDRQALATYLERSLPRQTDGTISLIARAWAVRGIAG